MEKLRNQLPGLTGLRFFAALLVILCHLEQFKVWTGFSPIKMTLIDGKYVGGVAFSPLFKQLAGDGVFFFFILSGFLITYLLFKELAASGTIAIGKFYARRALRILPLYYTLVFLGLIMCPSLGIDWPPKFVEGWDDFGPRLFFFAVMLPQVGQVLFPEVASTGHLWSVGVEEAFYLTWPLVIKATRKFSLFFILFVILGTFAVQNSTWISSVAVFHGKPIFETADQYLRIYCFQYLALGALGAWVAVHKPHWCKFLFRHEVQAIVYFLLIKHLTYYSDYGKWDALARGIPNLLFIMNVSLNPKTWFKFENRVLKYLGEISYGIYMYHILCIHLMVLLLVAIGKFQSQLSNSIFLYGTAIPLTIGCAAVSHHWLEKPFLNIRKKFQPIKSGEQIPVGAVAL